MGGFTLKALPQAHTGSFDVLTYALVAGQGIQLQINGQGQP
jgi:hypothetical protein